MAQHQFNQRVADELLFRGYFIAGRLYSPRVGYFPLYPESRKVFSITSKLKLVAEELAKTITPMSADLVASREAAGIPFGVATALEAQKGFLYLRKEPKGYITNSVIEGVFEPGQRVVIVDDAVSRTHDKKTAIDQLSAAGLRVVGVSVLLDAAYGVTDAEQAWLRQNPQYQFTALVRWDDLMRYAAEKKFISQALADIVLAWIADPFRWGENPENWQRFKAVAAREPNVVFDPSFEEL